MEDPLLRPNAYTNDCCIIRNPRMDTTKLLDNEENERNKAKKQSFMVILPTVLITFLLTSAAWLAVYFSLDNTAKPKTFDLQVSRDSNSLDHNLNKLITSTTSHGTCEDCQCNEIKGYTWCASKQKCIRTWEQDCPPPAHAPGDCSYLERGFYYCWSLKKCMLPFMGECPPIPPPRSTIFQGIEKWRYSVELYDQSKQNDKLSVSLAECNQDATGHTSKLIPLFKNGVPVATYANDIKPLKDNVMLFQNLPYAKVNKERTNACVQNLIISNQSNNSCYLPTKDMFGIAVYWYKFEFKKAKVVIVEENAEKKLSCRFK